MPTLIDTSVWIAYVRPKAPEELIKKIDSLIDRDEAFTCPIIILELLSGARDKNEYKQLEEKFSVLPNAPITDEVWKYAWSLSFSLKSKGITIPLTDIIIASVALVHDYPLLHKDNHFEAIKDIAPLKTIFFS